MSDLIDRQDAINAMMALQAEDDEAYGCHIPEGFDGERAKEALEQMPSAQPERKKGFWYTLKKGDKGYSAGDFKCSVCGEPNHTWLPKPKFCPNCGAEMSAFEEPIKINLGIN